MSMVEDMSLRRASELGSLVGCLLVLVRLNSCVSQRLGHLDLQLTVAWTL